MAQSNYTLANKSAPASRAKINDVFESIATNNSGSSAPATTFPHQWWYDTTTNILKQRNAADSAWIDIGSFDQTGGTFTPAGAPQLTQTQAEDPTSTVFGTVSGEVLAGAIDEGIKRSDWELVHSHSITTAAAGFNFTNLGDFREIMVVTRELTTSVSTTRQLQVSTDNGANFLSSAIYATVNTSIQTSHRLSDNSAGSRSMTYRIFGFNADWPEKPVSGGRTTDDVPGAILVSQPLNAVRVFAASGNLADGSIRIYGKR